LPATLTFIEAAEMLPLAPALFTTDLPLPSVPAPPVAAVRVL
jgi:hypothetical protein